MSIGLGAAISSSARMRRQEFEVTMNRHTPPSHGAALSALESAVLGDVSIAEPWALVETFSTWVREHPTDVNRAMDHVAARLKSFGVPVTMHEPKLYLSLPGKARVEAGGKSFRAKPPAYSADARNGFTGELVYIAANQADDIDTIFDMKLDKKGEQAARAKGKIVISEGFASPGLVSQFEELGAVGVIGINPGVDIHWGICTTIWGVPDLDDLPRKPKVPVVAVNNPDGAGANRTCQARRQGHDLHRDGRRLVRLQAAGRRNPRLRGARKIRVAARPSRFLGCRRWRQRSRRRSAARDGARALGEP